MRLETERLILRDWVQTDLTDLVEGLNDLNVARWLAYVPHPYTRQDAEKWINFCMALAQKQEKRDAYEFAIILKQEERAIGGLSINRINQVHGTAGGGIWLNSKYQGRGYGSEAFSEKIRFAFEDLNLRRLENGYFPENSASLAMQQRFGFKLEGEKRRAYCCMADGKFKNECITGLLKEEWIRP